MPTIYATLALPGAGKSTVVNGWAAEGLIPAEAIVSGDALRLVLTGDPGCQEENDAVYAMADSIVSTRVRRGLDAVCDFTHLDERARFLVASIAEWNKARLVWVIFPASPGQCIERNARRTGTDRVPSERMIEMVALYETLNITMLPGEVRTAEQVYDELSSHEFSPIDVPGLHLSPTCQCGEGPDHPTHRVRSEP